MRILICDDEQMLIDLEVSILQEYCRSTNIAATFFTFTDSLSAGNIGEFDIAFLDIDMEKVNGIELARKLRLKNPTSIIIFVTNFIQYAPEGYEVNAFRYLSANPVFQACAFLTEKHGVRVRKPPRICGCPNFAAAVVLRTASSNGAS